MPGQVRHILTKNGAPPQKNIMHTDVKIVEEIAHTHLNVCQRILVCCNSDIVVDVSDSGSDVSLLYLTSKHENSAG